MRTWRQVLDDATASLGSRFEARQIVRQASGFERNEEVTGLDAAVPARAVVLVEGLVRRRRAGEPLQYVLGSWAFRNLDLFVDRRVLIPRPETEEVAGIAIDEVRRLATSGRGAVTRRSIAVDLGTGSGAIALSLAVEVPEVEVWATDASADALAVARANLAGIGTFAGPRVRLVEGQWFDALPPLLRGRVQLIVSNPPYVADGEALPDEVAQWEPRQALRSGPSGLEAIDAIVSDAPAWLARPGVLVVEVAPHQAVDASALAFRAGFVDVAVRADLSGRDRALVARLPGGAGGAA